MLTLIKTSSYDNNLKKQGSKYHCVVCGKPAPETSHKVMVDSTGENVLLSNEVAENSSVGVITDSCSARHPEIKPYIIEI